MAIDWANEPFVRLYKRETDEDLLLSWEARAVWHEMLKKFDQSGLLETRRGVRGLAALIRIPLDVVERGMPELLEDGRIRSVPDRGFLAPNYTEANFTPRSDAARQEQSRLKRRLEALNHKQNGPHCAGDLSHAVTPVVTSGHTPSLADTHIRSDQTQINTDHQSASPPAGIAPEAEEPKARRRQGISPDWKPRDSERKRATELGLNCDHEASEFLTYWLGDGRPKKDWDQTFLNRLLAQAKRRPTNGRLFAPPAPVTRKIKDLE